MRTAATALPCRSPWRGIVLRLLLGLGLWGWAASSPAQLTFKGKLKNFLFPDYYAPASATQTNQVLKSVVSGAEAEQIAGGAIQISGLRIQSFREDGRQELEVQAEGCLFDPGKREASGPGRLTVTSASALSSIAGEGFFWRQSDGFMVISNHVLSTLQRGLLAGGSMDLLRVTNLAPALSQAPTGQVVRITSDRCLFLSASNRFEQTGHVVVDDAQVQLGCESLKVRFTPARRLQEIVAEQDVQLLNKADQSRVKAGRAVYQLGPERETILLTEHPSWQDRDGGQWVKAGRFTYDLKERSLLGEGGAAMQLPRSSFIQPGAGLEQLGVATNAPGARGDTNHIQVTAQTMTMLLASTNRPQRRMVAETGVVVVSPADDLRATGDRLVLREEAGLAELIGHATWSAAGRAVRADTLVIDRTNKVFRGSSNACFHLPLQSLGSAGLSRSGTNRVAVSNLFLEVFGDEFVYRTNTLEFQGGQVRARLLEGESQRGLLTCSRLTAHLSSLSNRIDWLMAEKHVVVENSPPPGTNGLVVTNLLTCETLAARFSESGEVIAMVASENVQAAQIQVRKPPGGTGVSELTCGLLTAVMLPKAGRMDKLQAEQHVAISQGDKRARAARALYTDKENQVILTGHPEAEFAGGKVTGADTLVWDRASGAFQGRGRYRLEWTKPTVPTNLPAFLFQKQ